MVTLSVPLFLFLVFVLIGGTSYIATIFWMYLLKQRQGSSILKILLLHSARHQPVSTKQALLECATILGAPSEVTDE